jgi:hypothetical protein
MWEVENLFLTPVAAFWPGGLRELVFFLMVGR